LGDYSIFEKLGARKRMLDAAFSGKGSPQQDNSAPAPVAKKAPVEKRVPYRTPEGKVEWRTILVDE